MSNILNCKENLQIINSLKNRNLLNKTARCDRCFIEMEWEERLVADGYTCKCSDCKTTKSVRHGSFFQERIQEHP
jgi:hypothetical protein